MADVSETEREGELTHDRETRDSTPGPSGAPKVPEGRTVRGTRRESTRFVGALYLQYYHGYLILQLTT